VTGDGATRASDQEREDTVRELGDAYAAGRLDLGELRGRAQAAYAARTWAQLRALTADLPGPGAEARSGPGREAPVPPGAYPARDGRSRPCCWPCWPSWASPPPGGGPRR
jgi:hypothetical protein